MFFQFGRLRASLIFLSLSFRQSITMTRIFLISFFLLLSFCNTKLQADDHFQKLYKFTTEHGLENNTVLSIFQDSTGLLWIGTLEGLNSYNGEEFESYSMSDSVVGNAIHFIDKISKNELLLGTNKGNFLFSIADKHFTKLYLTKDHHPKTSTIFQIQNKIFIGSKTGVFEYDKNTKACIKVSNESISCKQISPEGTILLGTVQNGILKVVLNANTVSFISHFSKIKNEKVLSIQYTNNKTPIILTDKGLWIAEQKEIKVPDSFTSLSISQNDEIILGTNSEFIQQVYQADGQYILKNYINPENEIFNDYYDSQVNILFHDFSGSIWVGTNRAGLKRIDRKKITYKKYKSCNLKQKSEAGYINGITQSRDGKIWIGTSGKGLYLLDSEKEELIPTPILQGNINDLYIEAITHYNDKLYIGTRHMGILTASYTSQNSDQIVASGQLFSNEAGLNKNDYIYALKQFNKKLYICSNKGSFVCNGETHDLVRLDTLPCIDIKLDSLNNTWVLSLDMELYYNQNKYDLASEISDFYIDNNTIWASTSKGLALIQTDGNKPVFFNPPDKVIQFTSIKKDKDGQFWLGSRMGIYRFDPKNKLFAHYQIPGGSKANSFNHGKLLHSHTGEFYWGSNDGVVSINPNVNYYLPEPLFKIEQENKGSDAVLKVSNYSFNHQEDNSITYKFSHPDSIWHIIPKNNATLDFSYLQKGSYTINVSAINADGLFNKSNQTYHLDITNSNKSGLSWWLLLIVALSGFIIVFLKQKQAIKHIEETENSTQIETPEDKIYSEWMRDDFMQKAILLIENSLSNNSFGVSEVYAGMQMSKSNFYRKLKTNTDLSPNELIRFIRLKKSTQLLISPDLSVNEIAYEVGFNTPSYFTRCFKQQFGIAPSEYKEHYESLYNIEE